MGTKIEIDAYEGQQIYVCITSTGKTFKVSYENFLHEENRDPVTYSMNQKYVLDLGYMTEDSIITIASDEGNKLQCFVYELNQDVFDEFCKEFDQSTWNITSYDDTHMEGTIDVKEYGIFVSNIIYDNGWTVYVDGKEVEYEAFKDALISFQLTEGTHEIKFSYFPHGLKEGLIISVISLVAFITIAVLFKLPAKKDEDEPEDEDIDVAEPDVVKDDTTVETDNSSDIDKPSSESNI